MEDIYKSRLSLHEHGLSIASAVMATLGWGQPNVENDKSTFQCSWIALHWSALRFYNANNTIN